LRSDILHRRVGKLSVLARSTPAVPGWPFGSYPMRWNERL
jgi:hypothetical protein